MSTNIATLADVRAQLAARLQTQRASLPPATGSKVKAKAKEGFLFPDGTVLKDVEAVVTDVRYANALYKRYTPGQPETPDCWALSSIYEDLAPSDLSSKKVASKCDACPKNEFGSAANGQGKACKNMIRLSIVSPDATETSPVYTMDLAPTSIKQFVSVLRDLKETPYQSVVLQFSLDPKVDYPKVHTTLLGPASDELQLSILSLIDKSQPLINRGFDYDA